MARAVLSALRWQRSSTLMARAVPPFSSRGSLFSSHILCKQQNTAHDNMAAHVDDLINQLAALEVADATRHSERLKFPGAEVVIEFEKIACAIATCPRPVSLILIFMSSIPSNRRRCAGVDAHKFYGKEPPSRRNARRFNR
jgi:hypothetical protein